MGYRTYIYVYLGIEEEMLSPSLRSVLRSLLRCGREDALERDGWLLLSIDDEQELLLLPILRCNDKQSRHLTFK